MNGTAKELIQEPQLKIKLDNITYLIDEIEDKTNTIITTSNKLHDIDDREPIEETPERLERDFFSAICIVEDRLSRIKNNLNYVSNKFQNLIG